MQTMCLVHDVRGNFVEDEYYQMATELQETSLRPDISVVCTCHVIRPLTVTSAHLMMPGIGMNMPSAMGDFHFWSNG